MNNDKTETINMEVGGSREVNFEVVGGSGTSNYERLSNKPQINSVELIGNLSSEDLGLQPAGEYLTEETDPIFSNSPSADITSEDITNWNNKSDFSGSYNDLTDTPDIPSKTSDLTNNSGFIDKTVDDLTNYTKTSSLAIVATSGSYNDLSNKPTIPDVSNFITKDVNNLTYYTLKTSTGSLIDLEVNSSTYVVTLYLKDIDGNVISTDSIDLPLESVVVSGSFDSTNKKIILTLQNGNTVDIPVGDLVAGLQTEITSTNKIASDLIDDSNSGNKFVTTSEKQTWDGKADISDIPTNVSELTNDSGYITGYTETDPVFSASPSASITSQNITSWNNKYDKPIAGIPKTDLASGVQASLDKADTAIQDISGKLDVSKVKTTNSTTSGDVYDVTYINSLVGDIDTALDLINGEVVS